ncbi:putative ribonuclease H-like domain-containing protein, partial [Tanacetum coccineum]
VKQQPDGIFISQDKYIADILKKFAFCSIKSATTPIASNKPLVKDEDGVDVDVHICRSMIGSLMYLTASRPNIMFPVWLPNVILLVPVYVPDLFYPAEWTMVQNMTTAGTRAVVNTGKGKLNTDLKRSRWFWRPKGNYLDHVSKDSGSFMLKKVEYLDPKGISKFWVAQPYAGNKAYLSDYEDLWMACGFLEVNPKEVNVDAGTQDSYIVGSSGKDKGPTQEYILLPLQPHRIRIPIEDVAPVAHETPSESSPKENDIQDSEDAANKESEQDLQDELKKMVTQELAAKAMDDVSRQAFQEEKRRITSQKKAAQATSTNKLSTDRQSVSTDRPYVSTDRSFVSTDRSKTSYISAASTPTSANTGESYHIMEYFNGRYDNEDVGAVANFNNMDNTIAVSPIPTLRIHKDYPKGQILGDPTSAVQTRGKIQKDSSAQQALTISQALQDESWVKAMQEELLQFKLQKVWVLVDLPYRKKEEGIYYDEVFAPVARIRAIRRRCYVITSSTSHAFVDPAHPNKVYKVIKALYGLHQAPRAWYETLSSFLIENSFRRGTIDKTLFIKKKKSDIMLVQVYVDDIIFGSTTQSMCTEFEDCMHKRFQMSSMGELTFFLGLQVKQQPDGIFISQDKYVADILKKFDFCSIKTATTPIVSNKPLVKDEDGVDVDVHIYRSMICSLMYLTALRPDIMLAVSACARFQVTPKASHLNAIKRIFRYLKHQPKLGLWYPRDSPFELEAFSDSDYGGASLDRKSTTGGCQFLGRRLISWQCTKQTIMANSTTEAEYVATANCFKNPVYHSRTKHIEIRHHFIMDCYKKILIDVIKIYTDANVADLLTKGFDVTKFNFLVIFLHEAPFTMLSLYNRPNVAGKPLNILEASIRSDLLFDDADGIDSLLNQAIFDAIQLMGHLDAKKKFVMYPRFISVFLDKQLKNVLVPLDHFLINALTSKVFSLYKVKKENIFYGQSLPMFESIWFKPIKNEGEAAERQSEPQPTPSPPYPSADQHKTQPDPSPRPSPTIPIPYPILEGSGRNHGGQSSSDRSLSGNEDGFTLQIYKKLKKKANPVIPITKKLDDKLSHEAKMGQEKNSFEENGKLRRAMGCKWETDALQQKGVSTEDQVSTVKPDEGTEKPKVSTDKPEVSTAKPKEVEVKTDKLDEDDETVAEFLVSMSQTKAKQKGVEIKDAEDSDRPRATSTRSVLTLKPLPKIDPKDKGKKVLEEEAESDAESEGVDEAERKFDQLAKDEEIARKARIEADRILAARLQEEAREMFIQVGGKKHADLKNKNFKEIQVLFKKVKRSDKDFIAISSAEDERQIKEMNEESKDLKEEG